MLSVGGKEMIFAKGYTFTKVNTSHGQDMYISRFGEVVSVVPYSTQADISNLIQQIESIDY
jgi:hypothetical protein